MTDDHVLAAPDFLAQSREIVQQLGNRVALHLRARGTASRTLYDLAVELRGLPDAVVIVNERVDVGLAAHAAGVQLPQGGLPVAAARQLLGEQRWIGCSVHQEAEAVTACAQGADFLLAGTIYASASHPELTPRGPDLLSTLRVQVDCPIVAIGGIDAQRVGACCAAGAYGVAVIRAVWRAPRPVAAARELLDCLQSSSVKL